MVPSIAVILELVRCGWNPTDLIQGDGTLLNLTLYYGPWRVHWPSGRHMHEYVTFPLRYPLLAHHGCHPYRQWILFFFSSVSLRHTIDLTSGCEARGGGWWDWPTSWRERACCYSRWWSIGWSSCPNGTSFRRYIVHTRLISFLLTSSIYKYV